MNYDSAKIKFRYILFRFELYSRIEKKNHYNCLPTYIGTYTVPYYIYT